MLYYKFFQVKSSIEAMSGKYYACTIKSGDISTEQLAEHIQANCTVKYSDVLAVLRELFETMKEKLQEGYSVHLDNIGYFRIAVSSKLVDSIDEFNQSTDMRAPRVIFTPESTKTKDSEGKYRKTVALTSGVKVRELPKATE